MGRNEPSPFDRELSNPQAGLVCTAPSGERGSLREALAVATGPDRNATAWCSRCNGHRLNEPAPFPAECGIPDDDEVVVSRPMSDYQDFMGRTIAGDSWKPPDYRRGACGPNDVPLGLHNVRLDGLLFHGRECWADLHAVGPTKMAIDYARLATWRAKKHRPRATRLGIPWDDLTQQAQVGLVEGCRRYRPELGAVTTICTWWIDGMIRQMIDREERRPTPVDTGAWQLTEDDTRLVYGADSRHRRRVGALYAALDQLQPESRRLISAIYGIDGAAVTRRELAYRLRVSRDTVRDAEREILRVLKDIMITGSRKSNKRTSLSSDLIIIKNGEERRASGSGVLRANGPVFLGQRVSDVFRFSQISEVCDEIARWQLVVDASGDAPGSDQRPCVDESGRVGTCAGQDRGR
jgi:RNA polymerase sigma factor (sigma-70 family)